jgi:hypothetical protein
MVPQWDIEDIPDGYVAYRCDRLELKELKEFIGCLASGESG